MKEEGGAQADGALIGGCHMPQEAAVDGKCSHAEGRTEDSITSILNESVYQEPQ